MKFPTRLVILAFVSTALLIAPETPARACSCAGPFDLQTAIDESEAAFVGKMLEKRSSDNEWESIYVFEVEKWVKGDAGRVIEVRSASDGAGCGFEFPADQRIGAFIRMESGELHGGLCSQVDADALLAASGEPTLSESGVARLLVANVTQSNRLTILDEVGARVTVLDPESPEDGSARTSQLDVCPEERLMVQLTNSSVNVWDLHTLQQVAAYPVSDPDGSKWAQSVKCREPDASSIWAIFGSEGASSLYEIVPERRLIIDGLPGIVLHIGNSFLVSQPDIEDDPTLIDVASGARIRLHETAPDRLEAINIAPHPSRDLVALLETRFSEGGPVEATLLLFDSNGQETGRFEIPWEAYRPVWLDDQRILVEAYSYDDWSERYAYVVDISTGDQAVIDGWPGQYPVADGNEIYGVAGGEIVRGDTQSGSWHTLVNLPTQSAGPLVVLDETPVMDAPNTTTTDAPGPTTPPLVAPELDVGETPSEALQWLARSALVVFVAGLVWLARRPN